MHTWASSANKAWQEKSRKRPQAQITLSTQMVWNSLLAIICGFKLYLYLAVFKEIERAAAIAAAMVTAIMETIRVPKKRFLPQTRLDWARWEPPHQSQFNRKGKVISKCKDVWSGSADINMGIHLCKIPNKMITVKDSKPRCKTCEKKGSAIQRHMKILVGDYCNGASANFKQSTSAVKPRFH